MEKDYLLRQAESIKAEKLHSKFRNTYTSRTLPSSFFPAKEINDLEKKYTTHFLTGRFFFREKTNNLKYIPAYVENAKPITIPDDLVTVRHWIDGFSHSILYDVPSNVSTRLFP